MRTLTLSLLCSLALACTTQPAEPTPVVQDTTAGDGEGPDLPDAGKDEVAAPDDVQTGVDTDVPDASMEDAVEPPDVPSIDAPEIVEPTTPQTALNRLMPGKLGDVLAIADATGLTLQLVGGLPIQALEFQVGDRPSSPVAIAKGLLCWDIDKDGIFTATKEDFDGDGAPTPTDCALHPGGASPGRAGFLVAVNSAAGCVVHAVTTTGAPAWDASFSGECQQPTVANDVYAIIPVTAGTDGVVRLVDARSGVVKNQVTLPSAPTTSAAYIGDGRYGIGLAGSVAAIGIATGGGTGIFVTGSVDVSPERPTAVFRAGVSTMGVVTRRAEDPPGSLGTHIRLFVFGDNFVELPSDIVAPGPIWALPVSGLIGQKWFIAAGGTGYTAVWSPATGSLVRTVPTVLGTTLALAYGADGRVYTAESKWGGDPALRGGSEWTLRAFDPSATAEPETLVAETAPIPVRWIGAPLLECDIAILQILVDADVPSYYVVKKPCSGSLAAGGFARPYGDNGNGGIFAPIPDCAAGPGVVPCKATSGCAVNTDCGDANACTIDTCVNGSCSYKFLAGCCATDDQCEDFDPCTENRCLSGKCKYPPAASCCESSSDCDDLNACTKDNCEAGQCEHFVDKTITGCCTSDFDCIVNIPCAKGVCTDKKVCEVGYTPNCCNSDAMCDDKLKCTKDTCTSGTCSHAPDPTQFGCCGADSDCTTGNVCIVGACDPTAATCVVSPIADCCVTNVQCNDKNQCTKDTCEDGKCVHAVDLTPKGCCDEDTDCVVPITACVLGYSCNVEKNQCENDAKNCDDEEDCTVDNCVEGECIHELKPNCCLDDKDCLDADPCSKDVCDPDFDACTNTPIDGCCVTAADCSDGDASTTEQCLANACIVHRCDIYPYEEQNRPLDLIFVIDQSTSMAEEILQIRTYMNQVASWIGGAGVDYHVVLLATRNKGVNAICIDPPLAGLACSNSARFMQIDEQVASHNSLELVMAHIDEIESFLRPGSSRQFIEFSDDISNVSAAEFEFFLSSRFGYEDFVFHAFVGFDGESCALKAGQDYLDLAANTGGLTFDICSSTWANSFTALGQAGATAGTSFALQAQPLPGTLSVSYDGQLQVEGVNYTYDPTTNRVSWILPAPATGKVLEICLDGNKGP